MSNGWGGWSIDSCRDGVGTDSPTTRMGHACLRVAAPTPIDQGFAPPVCAILMPRARSTGTDTDADADAAAP